MTNLDASYRVCACSVQRGNMQLLATPYVELDAVLGQSQQQRSCADLMSATVFVSLFSLLLLLLFLCVCDFATNFSFSWGQVCERSVLISLQQLAAPLAAAAAKVDAVFVASNLQMTNASKGAAAGRWRKGREGDCGKWFVSSVFVNMKLSAPTRGTCQCVIQHSIPFANFAERRKSRNRNESKIITICGSRFFFWARCANWF